MNDLRGVLPRRSTCSGSVTCLPRLPEDRDMPSTDLVSWLQAVEEGHAKAEALAFKRASVSSTRRRFKRAPKQPVSGTLNDPRRSFGNSEEAVGLPGQLGESQKDDLDELADNPFNLDDDEEEMGPERNNKGKYWSGWSSDSSEIAPPKKLRSALTSTLLARVSSMQKQASKLCARSRDGEPCRRSEGMTSMVPACSHPVRRISHIFRPKCASA